jgi:hypothetical protein
MNEESVRASSDLIRWLKMLALPGWAKMGLAAIMLLALGPLANAAIEQKSRGFITDYTVSTQPASGPGTTLHFRLELNVRKVNLVYWFPTPPPDNNARKLFESHPGLHSCLVGAEREGYVLNPVAQASSGDSKNSCVFFKTLHEDFLLSPAQRLYFAQDLSFFVRGLLEASVRHG